MPGFTDQLEAILPDLWRYAFSLLRDRDGADDLVQDSVERMLRKRPLWQSSRALRPWAFAILRNIYRNQCRDGARRMALPLEAAATLGEPPQAEGRLDLAETVARIAALPEDQREALLLVVAGGLSYKEAAQVLDIPMGTLMSRLSRARRRLAAEPVRPSLRSVS